MIRNVVQGWSEAGGELFGGAMRKFHGMPLSLVFALLWLPSAVMAGEAGVGADQPTVIQDTQAQTGSAPERSAAKENSAKKSDKGDVQSRGLFHKKKKKQKGGAAGHSQPSERADSPAGSDAGR